jgi:ribosomal protein S27E
MFHLQVKVSIQMINIYFHLHAQYTQKLLYTLMGLVIKSPHLARTDFLYIKCHSCNRQKIYTYTKFKECSSNGSTLCSL